MTREELLIPLQEIDGYLASLIFNMKEEIFLFHNASNYSAEALGSNIVAIMDAMVKAVSQTELGHCQFMQINSEIGIFGATWIIENDTAVAVLLEPKGNMGLAKLALVNIAESASSTVLHG